MGKKASLSQVQRAQTVTLHQEGYSERQISKRTGCSKTAVHNAISKFQRDGSFSDQKRSGRPRKTTPREDHVMRRTVVKDPSSSCRKIKADLQSTGTNVSVSTISRRLSREFGLKSHKPARKPLLTEAMKVKRLSFARKHESWTVQDWTTVLFSDESIVQQFGSRKSHVRRPRGRRFDAQYTVATVKHPPSQMIWGAMSHAGTSGLFFLPPNTTMNGPKYVTLLQDQLKTSMDTHKCKIFMQDGAPCHRSNVVKDFLSKNKVKVLDWPGNSPDLNPIENLWKVVKDKVADRQPSNAKALGEAIKQVWEKEISVEYCQSLISSMPRRIQEVIRNRGGHTKY